MTDSLTEGGLMEFRLFGEVELRAAGRLFNVGTPRQQAVLGALLVDVGRPVAMETLVDRVWDDAPPVEARNVLYSHLSRIRQMLGEAAVFLGEAPVRISRQHAGYVLEVDPDRVDLHRFSRLVDHGCDPRHSDAEQAGVLMEALTLWRGPPLAALGGRWAAQVRSSWHRRRLDAIAQWAQAELRLGHPAAVSSVLHDLVTEYPLAEPLECLLMRALNAAGRGAEAIDRYAAIRRRLAHELGVDPGPELRALHQAMLRGEHLPSPRERAATTGRLLASPAQLPPDIHGFSGRDTELNYLDGLVTAGKDRSTAVTIIAVSGTAGVGKTALAVHWAHRVRDEFPDGQLYVNLQGFDPGGSPVPPAEAVRRFLDALEVPPQRIPASFEAQVGLYRSLLAGRRVLVVLDNGRDAEQVRPLLPGAPGCVAVVNSRDRLSGLVASGAHLLTLDLLSAVEARRLLAGRLGPGRISAEPRAVDEIITLCARLPLALAIVAARASAHPGFHLEALAHELCETRGGLDRFAGLDLATDPRTVFSWSYHQQSPAAARLFRLLGLHPGPDIATPAVASLTGLSPAEVRPLLAALAGAHLINEHLPGRYTFHDLLRAYAAEQARATDPEDQRRAAIQRVLDHYLHTAHTAAQLLNPSRDPVNLSPVQSGVTPEHPADHGGALAWFTSEHLVLLAAAGYAARTGWDSHMWHLAWSLNDFLDRRGHWQDAVDVLGAAVDAARRLADPPTQACAHRLLARPYTQLGRLDDAHAHLQRALDLYREHGDLAGQGHTHTNLTFTLERQGRHDEALAHAQQALTLYRAAGKRYGEANSLNNIGWYHGELGDHQQALTFCQQALSQHQELGNRPGQAMAWDSLGYAHQHLGHHAEAIACYRHSVELFRELGHHEGAITLDHLGDTYQLVGDLDAAATAWRQSLAVLDHIGHPHAGTVCDKLTALGGNDGRSRGLPRS